MTSPFLPLPGLPSHVGHEAGVAVAEGMSEPHGSLPLPSLYSPGPLPLLVPPAQVRGGGGVGEEGRRRQPGRKGPGSQSRETEGQVPACWGRMAAETGSEPQGPWDGQFPTPFSPQTPYLQPSGSHLPPHTSKLHPPSSPPRPPLTSSFPSYPGPRRMSECLS